MEKQAKRITEIYLDWYCNFLSVEAFASHYGFSIEQANQIIQLGREINHINLDPIA